MFYKEHGLKQSLLTYGISEKNNTSKTVSNSNKTVLANNKENNNKPLNEDLDTVKKQFMEKEHLLKLEIEQQEKIISIKDNQTQKYALLKIEEQREKETWINKYDLVNTEKNDWIKNFYSLKTYLIVFIILFVLSTTALVIKLIRN